MSTQNTLAIRAAMLPMPQLWPLVLPLSAGAVGVEGGGVVGNGAGGGVLAELMPWNSISATLHQPPVAGR